MRRVLIILSLLCLLCAKTVQAAKHVIFSKDGSTLIYTNDQEQLLTAIDSRTGKVLRKIDLKLGQGKKMIAATPDGLKLLYADAKGISVIHNGMGKVLRTLPHPQGYAAITEPRLMAQNTNGSIMVIPYAKGRDITLFGIHTGSGKVINKIELPYNPLSSTGIEAVAFSFDNRTLAYTQNTRNEKGQLGSTLILYDLYAKRQVSKVFMPNHRYKGKPLKNDLQFSKNGKSILISFADKITVVDTSSLKFLDIPARRADAVFSANSQSILFKSATSAPMMASVRTGKVHIASNMSIKATSELVQSADKRFVVAPVKAANKESFVILNPHNGAVLRVVEEQG